MIDEYRSCEKVEQDGDNDEETNEVGPSFACCIDLAYGVRSWDAETGFEVKRRLTDPRIDLNIMI